MKTWVRFLVLIAMTTLVADGATLARWNTTGVDPTLGNYEATETAEEVTTSALEIGDGLSTTGVTSKNTYAARGYETTSAMEAMEAGDYWETSLTVESGHELQLTGITVSFGGPKSGPTACQLAWSVDGKETWTYLREFDLTRTSTRYLENSISASELIDLAAGTVWFRLVAWGGSTAATAWGNFGQSTDGLVFEGEVIATEGIPPTVRFRPEEPMAYVGEMLMVLMRAWPTGAALTSITVNPPPKGEMTPNLLEGVWTFVPDNEDFNKTFTLTATVSNEYGEATGNVGVHVKGTVAEENGVTWRFCLVDETAMVTGASPAEGELIIPSSLGGYLVTSIGESAFFNCNGLTSVTIPDSVTSIASNAFAGCNGLTSVTIPQVVCNQRMSSVFPASYQLFTNVVIGAKVKSIGNYAFSGCNGLTSVTIPDSVASIGNGAFSGCNSLTVVHIHDLAAWSALSFSGGFPNPHHLFLDDEEVTDVVIPEGVTSIGEGPFSCCSGLRTVTISGSVTNIGPSAFRGCTNLIELPLPGCVTSIGTNAFADCRSLKTLNIPHGVGIIGDNAFLGCSAISSLSIGRGVRSIGNQAFAGCTSLKTVTIPKNVTTMGTGVFSGCTSLISIMILGNLKVTGSFSPFSGCSSLTSVVWGGNVTKIGNYLCEGLNGLSAVVIPPSVTNIGNKAFYKCTSLKSLKLSDGLLSIGTQSLSGCSSLTTLKIPNTVTKISSCAFENCNSLATLYVPASWEGTDKLDNAMVPSTCTIVYGEAGEQEESGGTEIIGNVSWTYAVSNGAASIVHVSPADGELVVPTTLAGYLVICIGDGAFSGCSELMALTIPDSITGVGADVFSGCDGLLELHVPAWWTGTDILGNASVPTTCEIVYGEDGLDTESIDGVTWFYVVVDDMVSILDVQPVPEYMVVPSVLDGLPVESIGNTAFAGYNALHSATLPESVTHIGNFAFQGCVALGAVTILGDVTDDWKSDGNSPFLGCSGLNKVSLGNNVTKIGNYMFDQCNALQSLTIPDGITNIGNRAFGFCSSLETLELGQGLVRIGDAAFRTCTALKFVMIPDSVTTVGNHAFYQCSNLEAVTLGYGTQITGQGVFRDCDALKSVALPHGLKRMGRETFYNCHSLQTLLIPGSVTNIGIDSFYGCSSLETLWIPASWEGTDMLADTAVPNGCKICYYNPDAGEDETMTTPVPVPHGWLEENAASLLAANTNDYEAVASGPAANGQPVWACYLAGLAPEDENAAFKAKLAFVDGEPIVEWTPDLNEGGTKTERAYRVWGKKDILDTDWTDVTDIEDLEAEGWRFFRVGVEMAE